MKNNDDAKFWQVLPLGARHPMRMARWTQVIVCFAFLFNPAVAQEPKIDRTPPEKVYAQEYHQSFKGKLESGWELVNPGADSNVRFEPTGLRITLPPGRDGGHKATGVRTNFGVKGDFAITVSFEIFKEADPGTNRTVLDLIITKDVPRADVTTIGRLMSPKEGNRFIAWANMWDPVSQKMVPHSVSVPTKVMTGRLRLVRFGNEVHYGFSDGFEKDFRYIKKFPFGVEDVRRVRIVGSTSGDQATLDVRVTDFIIGADAIPNLPIGPASVPVAEPVSPAPPKNSLVFVLLFGLGILVLLALAMGALFLRRKRQNERQ